MRVEASLAGSGVPQLDWLGWLLFLFVLAVAAANLLIYRAQKRRITRLVRQRAYEQHEAEKRAQQSQQLEALGRLTAGVAHDFNNLLTVILGRTELLLPKITDPDVRQHVELIAESTRRAARLTTQLLAYGRRQAFSLEWTDLNTVVGGMREILGALMGDSIRIVLNLAPQLDPVLADAGQISQVIMNLATNARTAMPQGGQFEITSANCTLNPMQAARYGTLAAGDYVRLTIRDTGEGMPPEVRDRIFEPFFTTKPKGQGTGLGLASAYGIIAQSHGGMRVESMPGRGTLFFIVLPRRPPGAKAMPPERRLAQSHQAPTI